MVDIRLGDDVVTGVGGAEDVRCDRDEMGVGVLSCLYPSGRESRAGYYCSAHEEREEMRVYKKGKVRFFGGEARSLLHTIDDESLIRELAEQRVKENKWVGDVTIIKEIDGHTVRFTQKQARSLLLHVEEIV